MYKNIASQKVAIYAWDGASGTAKTGDAANITAWVGKDGAALLASDDVNPEEIGLGVYVFDITQTESNCDLLVLIAESSTDDVVIRPVTIYTQNLSLFKATGFSTHNADDVKTAMEAAGAKLTDLHDEALGKWELDPTAKTLTLFKADGITPLKIFDLGDTASPVPNFISRIPQ